VGHSDPAHLHVVSKTHVVKPPHHHAAIWKVKLVARPVGRASKVFFARLAQSEVFSVSVFLGFILRSDECVKLTHPGVVVPFETR
jgi:hypothetical protein